MLFPISPSIVFSHNKSLLITLLACFALSMAHAQYYKTRTGFASTITGSAYYTPPSEFLDTNGNFTYNQVGGGVILPLTGKMIVKEKDARPQLYQLFFNGGFTMGLPEINLEYTFRPRTLYNASAGLTGLYYFGNNNTLLGGGYAFVGEDQITYKDPDVRFAGFLVFSHLVKDKGFSYKFGALYTYILGRGIPFPIVGFSKDLTEKAHFNLTFPLSMSLSYQADEKNRYRVFVKPWGTFNNFNNEQADIQFNNGQIPVIQVRRTEIRSGAEAKLQLSKHLQLKVEAGATFYRALGFFYQASNSDNDLFTTAINPGAYFQLGLSLKIHRKAAPEGTKDPHLTFIDLSNFDLDDLDLNDLNFEKLDFGDINLDDIDLDDIDLDDIIEDMDK